MNPPRTLIARGHSWDLGNLDGAAWVELRHAEVPFQVDEVALVTHLPPDLLDAIAAAHAAGRLPHQLLRADSNQNQEKENELRKGIKVRFDGEISYGQDMSFWSNDFGDMVFTFVEKLSQNGLMVFEAPGFGEEGDYGNGKIYVSSKFRNKIVAAA
jgi:hypothetical protein